MVKYSHANYCAALFNYYDEKEGVTGIVDSGATSTCVRPTDGCIKTGEKSTKVLG